jgi:hypothetical protein
LGRLLLASLRHLVDEKKSAILCDCLGSLIEYFHANVDPLDEWHRTERFKFC